MYKLLKLFCSVLAIILFLYSQHLIFTSKKDLDVFSFRGISKVLADSSSGDGSSTGSSGGGSTGSSGGEGSSTGSSGGDDGSSTGSSGGSSTGSSTGSSGGDDGSSSTGSSSTGSSSTSTSTGSSGGSSTGSSGGSSTGSSGGSSTGSSSGEPPTSSSTSSSGGDDSSSTGSSSGEGSSSGGVNLNDAPIANNDFTSTNEDTSLIIYENDLLSNDSDPNGDSISIISTTNTSNGTLVYNNNSTYTYTPNQNYNGTDTFSYTLSDDEQATDTATVTITINSVNDAPQANDDTYSIRVNTTLTINKSDLLSNDIDVDNSLSIISNTQSIKGTLIDNGSTYTYTPNNDYRGSDIFTYTVSDGNLTDDATVNINVGGQNSAPQANDDSLSTQKNTSIIIPKNLLLSNDTDADNNVLIIINQTNPINGVLVDNNDLTYTYTPQNDFKGPDTFTYTVSDNVDNDIATVTINVTEIPNRNPVANDDSLSTLQNTALTINKQNDLLRNDTDADSDTINIINQTQPGKGTLIDNIDGTYTYTPNNGYNGTDTFIYTVSDGRASDTATVTITIGASNNPPVANDDSYATQRNTALTIQKSDLILNDTDVDLNILNITGQTNPSNGTLTDNGNSYTYSPNSGYIGTDTFTYTVSDGSATDTATVTITIGASNNPPVANEKWPINNIKKGLISSKRSYSKGN